MKKRYGFVSNSSSTSFVVTNKTCEVVNTDDLFKMIMKGYTKYILEKLKEYNEYHSNDELFPNSGTEIEVDNGFAFDLKNWFLIAMKYEEDLQKFDIEYFEDVCKKRKVKI